MEFYNNIDVNLADKIDTYARVKEYISDLINNVVNSISNILTGAAKNILCHKYKGQQD